MLNAKIKGLKRSLSIVMIVIVAIATQSCKKSINEEISPQTNVEELRQFVANSTGMALEKVVYSAAEKTFVVDNDGLISLSDAELRFKNAPSSETSGAYRTQQRSYSYLVSAAKAGNITVYADATVPADWVASVDNAIANWNSSGSSIHMTRVTSNGTTTTTTNGKGRKKTTTTTTTGAADIVVTTTYDAATSAVATTYYPSYSGLPGRQFTINTFYNSLGIANKIFASTHELGHAIGFTHTDGSYGTIIPGTPQYEAGSIMNSIVSSWVTFTQNDLLAVRTLYP